MSDLLLQFIYALFATCGFAIIFRVPLKHFPVCMIKEGWPGPAIRSACIITLLL